MTKNLIIIGNGVGMALSPAEFALKTVMPEVWNGTCLSGAQKNLIADCLKGVEKEVGPTSEHQMMHAQIAQFGHELITDVVEQEKRENWFTDTALTYPEAISIYVYNVARQLNENSEKYQDDPVFKGFLDHLVPFIHDTKSHIATLNYDTLFYSAFNDGHEVNGTTYHLCCNSFQTTTLVDGYLNVSGFDESNFEQRFGNSFGYYLHLHGSPLIITENNSDRKLKRHQVADHTPTNARHIILSDGALKPLLINRSDVLKMYWDTFNKAIEEVDEVLVIGYGGGDDHINNMLGKCEKPLRIVEWKDPEISQNDAESSWNERLGLTPEVIEYISKFDLIRLDNILDFKNWENLDGEIPF